MIIKEIVNLAKFSELSGVAAKDNLDAIVAFINLGMIELYTRFPIKVEEYLIPLQTGTSYYDMPNNFMYALCAYGEAQHNDDNQHVELSINDEDDEFGIFFNDWNTVQVPSPTTGSFISVLYVAKPEPITATQADDGVTQLDLPDPLIDCLLSYVGYRGHLGVKSDARSENNAQWQRFERNCQKAEKLGVAAPSDSMKMTKRLQDRGFV